MAKVTKADPSPAAAPFLELGISGVARYGAVSRTYEEFLRELQGPAGMKLYREAIDNDPIIGAFLFALQHLCRDVAFRIEPSQEPGIDTRLAERVAERVKGALFDDLDVTWPDMLSEILSMVPYGWALCEMTYKRCLGLNPPSVPVAPGQPPKPTQNPFEAPPFIAGPSGQGAEEQAFTPSKFNDGWLTWKSWGLRSQDTLFMWEWDANSRATVMQQMAPPDYKVRRIPLTKSLLFRTTINKNNPEGRSSIRNCMTSYLFKKNIQIIEGIGIERDLAGYPVFQVKEPDPQKRLVPPDIWNTKDANMVQLLQKIQQSVRSVRRDEQEGMVLPWWLTFQLVNTGSRRNFDTNTIIERYDQRIAGVMLADFIMLGHSSVGSKALASTKSSLFTTALNSFLENICAVVNRFAIPQMLRLNGCPPELAPTLAHGDAENIPIEALGGYIGNLAKAGMPIFPSPELESALLEAAKLPTGGVEDAATDPLTEDPGDEMENAPGTAQPKPTPVAPEQVQRAAVARAIVKELRQARGRKR